MEMVEFEPLLQVITTSLVMRIIAEAGLDEDTAIERLYSCALYAALETEETKVWHYSVPMLYELWKEESRTGQLVLPEH